MRADSETTITSLEILQYESRYLEQILAVESEAAVLALSQILKNAPTLSMAHPNAFKVDKPGAGDISLGSRNSNTGKNRKRPLPFK
jgi:hypothetical protein